MPQIPIMSVAKSKQTNMQLFNDCKSGWSNESQPIWAVVLFGILIFTSDCLCLSIELKSAENSSMSWISAFYSWISGWTHTSCSTYYVIVWELWKYWKNYQGTFDLPFYYRVGTTLRNEYCMIWWSLWAPLTHPIYIKLWSFFSIEELHGSSPRTFTLSDGIHVIFFAQQTSIKKSKLQKKKF